MFTPQKAQTGKRVYGSGGFAPNRGRVSATGNQGYVKRSLTQQTQKANMHGNEGTAVGATRVGNDGQSDTRSGLARQAMRRTMNQQRGVLNQRARPPVGQGPAPAAAPTANAAVQPGQATAPAANPTAAPAAPAGTPAASTGTQVPTVTIGQNGQMELPYDSTYGQDLYNSLGTFNDQLMQLQIGQQQQAAQYAQGTRDENLGYQQQKVSDLAGNAGKGMAFTSQYATDVGKTGAAHSKAIQDLDAGNSQYLSQTAAQRQAIQDQFNEQLSAAAADHAKTAADSGRHIGGATKKAAGSRRLNHGAKKAAAKKATAKKAAHNNQGNQGGGVHNHIHIHNHAGGNQTPPTKPVKKAAATPPKAKAAPKPPAKKAAPKPPKPKGKK